MGIDHVQVTLVDRHIGGLAHGASTVVQPGAVVGQLHKVLKVVQRAIAATAVQVHHKGRAVGGRKNHVVAANLHRVRRVAGVLGELFGRGFEQFAQMARFKLDPHAVHLGPGLFEHSQHFVVVAYIQAHFGQDAVGGGFNLEQAFLPHDVVGRNHALDVSRAGDLGVGVSPLTATAAAAALGLCRCAVWALGIRFAHAVCLRVSGDLSLVSGG